MSDRFTATVTGRSLGDHMCWPFHGTEDLVEGARGYVAEGLDRRERVTFCKITPAGMEHTVLSHGGQVRPAPGDGVPVIGPLRPEPGWHPSASPVPVFGRMTREAVSDGYTGLRILTDATDIARERDTRQWWVRSEHLIDTFGLAHPVTVVCGYDVDDLGADVLEEVACLHALTGSQASPFLLRAADAEGRLALSGEVDRSSAATLYHAVVAVAGDLPRPVVLDLSEHEFMDHTALVALDRAAKTLGTGIGLVGASPLTESLIEALELTGVALLDDP